MVSAFKQGLHRQTSMILLFLMILCTHQACMNNRGTYQVLVKIYADKGARHAIANYIHSILPHEYTEHIKASHNDFEMAHIKHYFGVIFNKVNRTLRGTNMQFKADFSDMYKHEYSELHRRYCVYLTNITDMTERFLNDFADPHKMGQNKILVIDCKDNNPLLPTDTHMASKNQCGKINGILLTNPDVMHQLIAEGLYKIFSTKSISQISDVNDAIQADICTYIQHCDANYELTGVFVKDLGLLTHSTLTDGGLKGYGYNIAGSFIKDFAHSDRHHLGHSDSNDKDHHDDRAFHRDDGLFHKRHKHDDDSCHYLDDHTPHHDGHEGASLGSHHASGPYHLLTDAPHYPNESVHPPDDLDHARDEETARHRGARYEHNSRGELY